MMIQSSNLSTLLSGVESGGGLQTGLLAEGGNTAAFTASLMQQLALLQGNLAKNANFNVDAGVLADLQAKAGALDGHVAGQGVQNFAALFGTALPTAKKVGQDINLDDTLSALADVLQTLQWLGTDSTVPALGQPVNDASTQTVVQNPPVDTASQSGQGVDPAAIAAAMSAAMQEPQPPVQQVIQQPVTAEVSAQTATAVAVVGNDALLAQKKNMPPGNIIGNHDVFAATQAGGDKQSLGLDGATASTLLSQDNAARNAGQDNQASTDNTEYGLAGLVNQNKGIESDKTTPSRMAADIAQLNQVVSAEKTVAVPAMSRHLGHPEWNKELGEKLVWMYKQDIPSAELRLNPQHLGPILIKVDVNQDQATVTFTAHNAAVKDAIEAALPKLREMLGGQQLNLADVNVSQQQSEQKQPRDFFQAAGGQQGRGGNPGQNDDTGAPANQAGNDIVEEIEAGRAIASNGLLSLFA